MACVLPSALARAEPPVLSLDRECSLSLYLGKVPCGNPSEDTILFRPTTGEEHVDVAKISQAIAPLIDVRLQDGTHIFESSGEVATRKARKPDEIIIFAVDCSMRYVSLVSRIRFPTSAS